MITSNIQVYCTLLGDGLGADVMILFPKSASNASLSLTLWIYIFNIHRSDCSDAVSNILISAHVRPEYANQLDNLVLTHLFTSVI